MNFPNLHLRLPFHIRFIMRLTNVINHIFAAGLIGASIGSLLVFNLINLFADGFIERHMILFSIFFIAPFTIGIGAFIYARMKSKYIREQELETKVLRYAATGKGIVSVTEIASRYAVNPEVCKTLLNRLQEQGVFDIMVSQDGVVYYKLKQAPEDSDVMDHLL